MSIITVKEAKKILGRQHRELPDSDIQRIIDEVEFMSTVVLDHIRKEMVPKSTVATSNKLNKKG